jgi:hypothetical protein
MPGHRTGWTPDGLDSRTPDDETGWVDTAWWTRTGDSGYGSILVIADHCDDAPAPAVAPRVQCGRETPGSWVNS